MTIWVQLGKAAKTQRLEAGDYLDVRPGLWHMFATPAGAVVIEVYWASDVRCDIERASIGGIMPCA